MDCKTDWNVIKAEYIAGGTSYRKLVEKYGVSRTTLERKAKAEQWGKLRRQAGGKATAKMVNAVSKKNAKVKSEYFGLVDKLMQKAEDIIESTPIWTPSTLKEMATALKYLKDCKGVKSEADAREQEARIAKLEHDIAEDDNSITEIKVTFGSDDGEDTSAWAE